MRLEWQRLRQWGFHAAILPGSRLGHHPITMDRDGRGPAVAGSVWRPTRSTQLTETKGARFLRQDDARR